MPARSPRKLWRRRVDEAFITSGRLGVAFGSTHGSPSAQRDIYRTFFTESKKQKYPDRRLPAVRFRVTDRERYDPVRLGVAVLAALRGMHPESLVIDEARLDARVGASGVGADLRTGVAADRIATAWERDLAAFRERRRPYLIYPAELP